AVSLTHEAILVYRCCSTRLWGDSDALHGVPVLNNVLPGSWGWQEPGIRQRPHSQDGIGGTSVPLAEETTAEHSWYPQPRHTGTFCSEVPGGSPAQLLLLHQGIQGGFGINHN
uniref:Uncharacterized protein n=1 Tax=Calidris pygmaea TaxID=425635 RepID=A0A8C3JB45_9CHAR